MIHITEGHYHELRDNYSGICTKCVTVKHGDCEPDAENYECESCGANKVQGIENLLVMGLLSIDENLEKPFAKFRSGKIVDLKF